MRTVCLGRTGLTVNQLGLGGIPIQRLAPARAARLLERALDLGVTFWDTARGYADSEAKMGRVLARRRDRAVVATKSPKLDAAGMALDIAASLKALRTDRIDLYQVHNLMAWDDFEKVRRRGGALETLRRAKRSGDIRFIGVSSHSVRFLRRLLKEAPEAFDTIQVPFNFVGDESGRRLLAPARRAGVGFIAMKPMGGGVLDRPDLALRYVLQHAGVVVIPGMESVGELRRNVALADAGRVLTAAETRLLERIRARLGRSFCRKCHYCQPCPQGIAIPIALAARTLLRRFNRDSLAGWCRDLMRQAAGCVDCGTCEPRCPYRLPIRALLKENVRAYRRGLRAQGIAWKTEA